MRYIIGLIGVALAVTLWSDPLHLTNRLKGTVADALVPTPRENTTLARMKESQAVLGAFLADTAPAIIKNGTPEQKEKVQQAQQAFISSGNLLNELEQQIKEDAPGIIGMMVKKVFASSPTPLPDHCQVVCSQ